MFQNSSSHFTQGQARYHWYFVGYYILLTKPGIYFTHSLVYGQVNEATAQAKVWEDN